MKQSLKKLPQSIKQFQKSQDLTLSGMGDSMYVRSRGGGKIASPIVKMEQKELATYFLA